jgi:hypothetical protein
MQDARLARAFGGKGEFMELFPLGRAFVLPCVLAGVLAGCAGPAPRADLPAPGLQTGDTAGVLNRVTWGASPTLLKHVGQIGIARLP